MLYKLLVVVPYRNREQHLQQFIPYISKALLIQDIKYKIIVVEQFDNNLFNRGLLCNIGFYEFSHEFDYVCFHDVDMICPIIDYSYSDIPLSLIRIRSKVGGEVFNNYFGGIVIFPSLVFKTINGFSNNYWGWGCEDDDLKYRCVLHSISTDFRRGECNDLEMVSSDTNRILNPNYDNNLSKLKYFKKFGTISDINNDGLNQVYQNILKINTIEYSTHTLIQCQTKQYT